MGEHTIRGGALTFASAAGVNSALPSIEVHPTLARTTWEDRHIQWVPRKAHEMDNIAFHKRESVSDIRDFPGDGRGSQIIKNYRFIRLPYTIMMSREFLSRVHVQP